MAFMLFMGTWSYFMAAFSNPGIVKLEQLAQYRSEDLNEKLVKMFESMSRKKERDGLDEVESKELFMTSLMRTKSGI